MIFASVSLVDRIDKAGRKHASGASKTTAPLLLAVLQESKEKTEEKGRGGKGGAGEEEKKENGYVGLKCKCYIRTASGSPGRIHM